MFDNIKTLVAYWSGKVKDNRTLSRKAWVFHACILLILVCLSYSAFISMNAYEDAISDFFGTGSRSIAIVVTLVIAGTAGALIQTFSGIVSWTTYTGEVRQNRGRNSNQYLYFYWVVGLSLSGCLHEFSGSSSRGQVDYPGGTDGWQRKYCGGISIENRRGPRPAGQAE